MNICSLDAPNVARETLDQQRRAENPAPLADPASETPTMAQQQADALALLAETSSRTRSRGDVSQGSLCYTSSVAGPASLDSSASIANRLASSRERRSR